MNNPNAQYSNQRPMQGVANQMATHGRYGDSMMVHMNPVEVAGLASLSPTGSLTTNPVTGQPEAFLPFLAPLLGGMLGSTFLTGAGASILGGAGLSAAAAGAVGSGLATTALTGDLKQGIMSGLTGYGIGQAMQGATEIFNPAVADASSALTGAETALDAANIATSGVNNAAADAQIAALTAPANSPVQMSAATPSSFPNQNFSPAVPDSSSSVSMMNTPNTGSIAYKQATYDNAVAQAGRDMGSNFAGDPMKFAGQFGKELMSPSSILPVAVGEGARAQEMLSDDMRAAGRKRQGEKDQELADAYARRDYAVSSAREDSALNNPYSGAYGYNQGGLTSINPQDYMRQRNNLENMGRPPVQMFPGGSIPDFSRYMAGGGDAVETQRGVRPPRVVTGAELEAESAAMAAEGRDPRAGFGAEKVYFREPLPDPVDPVDPADPPADGNPPYELPPNLPTFPGKGGYNPNANMDMGTTEVESAMRANALRTGRGPFNAEQDAEKLARDNAAREAGNLVTGIGGDLSRNFASNYGDLTVPIYDRNQMAGGGIVSLAEGQGVPSMAPAMGAEGMNINAYPNQPPRQMDAPQMEPNEILSVISEIKQVVKADPDGTRGDQERYNMLKQKLEAITAQIGKEGVMELMATNTEAVSLAEGGMTPQNRDTQLLEQTTQAILGQLPPEQAEIAINMFVDTYGSEVFAQLRDTVLKSVVPNAQTEGKIQGQGGGMDDEVMGMIGNQQPVAVSPDEYIVPADVVSGIGDGSSNAGAEQLDEMLDRVRSKRTGTTRQPAPIQAKQGGVLPA